MKDGAGAQDGRRKIRVVYRVRIVLRLQAEGGVFAIDDSSLAGDCAVKEVSRIELHGGFRRPDLHLAS